MSINTDNYVTTLGPEMLGRAEDEFGETERLRETSLIAIREWIKKQPHLVSFMTTGKHIEGVFVKRFTQKKRFFIYINFHHYHLSRYLSLPIIYH